MKTSKRSTQSGSSRLFFESGEIATGKVVDHGRLEELLFGDGFEQRDGDLAEVVGVELDALDFLAAYAVQARRSPIT